jgi:hypothetical protein
MLGTAVYQTTTTPTTGSTAIPDGWEVPEGWDTETNAWIPGYGVPERNLAAGANCTRTPFSGAPWQLPTKDTLLIGAEYFDGESLRSCYYCSYALCVRWSARAATEQCVAS